MNVEVELQARPDGASGHGGQQLRRDFSYTGCCTNVIDSACRANIGFSKGRA